MYKIRDFTPRLYQESILNTATKANTLICLPTGRGKTKTAILIAVHRLNKYPESKVIFLTPTKPLAAQIAEEFRANTTIERVVMFTGETKPEKREELFKTSTVIVSTPQGMSNDIINKRVDLKNVNSIFFDECHRAVGEYDYVWIAKQFHTTSQFPRLIGMSASPGASLETINEICENLFVEDIEVRTDDDPDVKPYVKETKVTHLSVELPDKFKRAQSYLEKCYKAKLRLLKEFGFLRSISQVSKTNLLKLQRQIQARISQGERDPQIWQAMSVLAQAMKVQHAQELFETQGVGASYEYMKNLFKQANTTKVKATKNLVIDPDFKGAYYVISSMFELGDRHPKIIKLEEMIQTEIKRCDKILVFTNFRDTAKSVKETLDTINGVKSALFVGQTKKKGTGLSQKEQIKLLDDFRCGKFNVLIGTSVGEEGIDIPAVDLIVFFEPVPSAVRTVQRRGRTGRMKEGRVVVLVTKGTRDEAYRWTAYHKENKMHTILKSLKNKLNLNTPKERTLQSFDSDPSVKMFVDAREKGSGFVKYLVDQRVDVKMQNMDVGDIILSEDVAVERKEVKDFVDSILDKRIIAQIQSLKKHFPKPVIVIEGDGDLYSVRKVHPNAIRGMLAWIAVDMQVPIVYSKNYKDTAEILITIAKREQERKSKDFGIRGERKPLSTKELQEFIVEGLPGVGPSLARNLLKEFGSVKNVVNAAEKELLEIEKIGEKKAKTIFKILEEKYN